MRFYDIDGHEMDVQDPTYFIDEEEYQDLLESIEELINDYL